MVFFTSILIVFILYYLQTDGLIYVTVIAVVAELINIFMTQTLTKSVEKKAADKFGKIASGYKSRIATQERTIKELEDIQEESIKRLHNANLKIKKYEEKEILENRNTSEPKSMPPKDVKVANKTEPKEEETENFIDLPSGSNRKELPF